MGFVILARFVGTFFAFGIILLVLLGIYSVFKKKGLTIIFYLNQSHCLY